MSRYTNRAHVAQSVLNCDFMDNRRVSRLGHTIAGLTVRRPIVADSPGKHPGSRVRDCGFVLALRAPFLSGAKPVSPLNPGLTERLVLLLREVLIALSAPRSSIIDTLARIGGGGSGRRAKEHNRTTLHLGKDEADGRHILTRLGGPLRP